MIKAPLNGIGGVAVLCSALVTDDLTLGMIFGYIHCSSLTDACADARLLRDHSCLFAPQQKRHWARFPPALQSITYYNVAGVRSCVAQDENMICSKTG